jgi:hypothetical protein
MTMIVVRGNDHACHGADGPANGCSVAAADMVADNSPQPAAEDRSEYRVVGQGGVGGQKTE